MKNKKFRKSISLPKDFQFFEINKPSSIFQQIYNKNKNSENKIKNNININKTEEFLNIIEDMRLKEEMIETDKDYIIKESRNEAKLNHEISYLIKDNKDKYEKSNFMKIKLDKKIFLNPLEKNENKLFFTKSKSNINILKLPIINNKIKINLPIWNNYSSFKPRDKIFNSEANLIKININDDSVNAYSDDSKKINDSIFTYYSQKIKKKKSGKKSINTFLSPAISRKKKLSKQSSSNTIKTINTFNTINSILKQKRNSSDVDILNDFAGNKKIKKPVIQLLDNINEELKYGENKYKIFFRKNDYGCELSKFKINYLEKHFFQ